MKKLILLFAIITVNCGWNSWDGPYPPYPHVSKEYPQPEPAIKKFGYFNFSSKGFKPSEGVPGHVSLDRLHIVDNWKLELYPGESSGRITITLDVSEDYVLTLAGGCDNLDVSINFYQDHVKVGDIDESMDHTNQPIEGGWALDGCGTREFYIGEDVYRRRYDVFNNVREPNPIYTLEETDLIIPDHNSIIITIDVTEGDYGFLGFNYTDQTRPQEVIRYGE